MIREPSRIYGPDRYLVNLTWEEFDRLERLLFAEKRPVEVDPLEETDKAYRNMRAADCALNEARKAVEIASDTYEATVGAYTVAYKKLSLPQRAEWLKGANPCTK